MLNSPILMDAPSEAGREDSLGDGRQRRPRRPRHHRAPPLGQPRLASQFGEPSSTLFQHYPDAGGEAFEEEGEGPGGSAQREAGEEAGELAQAQAAARRVPGAVAGLVESPEGVLLHLPASRLAW